MQASTTPTSTQQLMAASTCSSFYWLREQARDPQERPSTSELIDWIAALRRGGISTDAIEQELPFLGVLLKRENDVEAALAAQRRGRVN